MSARLETHCRLILAGIAYSTSLAWGLNTGCSYLHHFNDYCTTSSNNKMTFNHGFRDMKANKGFQRGSNCKSSPKHDYYLFFTVFCSALHLWPCIENKVIMFFF